MNRSKSMNICDCGEEFNNETYLEEHKKNSCKNRRVSCELCKQNIKSDEIKTHLFFCGSKTEKCPKCFKFIQRSVYNYHRETNCAICDEDVIFGEENSSELNDQETIPCEFCHEQISFENYDSHSKKCSRNRNRNHSQSSYPKSIIDYTTDSQERNNKSNYQTSNVMDKPLETINSSLEEDSDCGKKLINSSTSKNSIKKDNAVSMLHDKTSNIQSSLASDYYPVEINHVVERLTFNILVMGSPRVGKSQLINALCDGQELAKTSSSLNSCTQNVQQYFLERKQSGFSDVEPFKITFYDTPGIESWVKQDGQTSMIKLIEEIDPICFIYCAAPGTFADLSQIHSILQFCKERKVVCAFVCTNMWSNANRKVVMNEFEKELSFFGQREEKLFPLNDGKSTHKVIVFGNSALCTMVNSKEYYDEDLFPDKKPVQGIDELVFCITELLSTEKLIGWCHAVLHRRTFWEKLGQQSYGFYSKHFKNFNFKNMNGDQINKHLFSFFKKLFQQ